MINKGDEVEVIGLGEKHTTVVTGIEMFHKELVCTRLSLLFSLSFTPFFLLSVIFLISSFSSFSSFYCFSSLFSICVSFHFYFKFGNSRIILERASI